MRVSVRSLSLAGILTVVLSAPVAPQSVIGDITGLRPNAGEFYSAADKLVVFDDATKELVVYDALSLTVDRRISIGFTVVSDSMVVFESTGRAYLGRFEPGAIEVEAIVEVDILTGAIVRRFLATGLVSLAKDESLHKLYAASNGKFAVIDLDSGSRTVIAGISPNIYSTMDVNTVTHDVYIGHYSQNDGVMDIVNGVTLQHTEVAEMGAGGSVSVDWLDNKVYLTYANDGTSRFRVYDATTGTRGSVSGAVGDSTSRLVLNPNNRRLYPSVEIQQVLPIVDAVTDTATVYPSVSMIEPAVRHASNRIYYLSGRYIFYMSGVDDRVYGYTIRPVPADYQSVSSDAIRVDQAKGKVLVVNDTHSRVTLIDDEGTYQEPAECSPIAVSLGSNVNGKLEYGDCLSPRAGSYLEQRYADRYSLTLSAGQGARAILTPALGFSSALLYLLGPTGATVATGAWDLPHQNVVLDFVAPAAGTYVLEVTVQSASGGTYSISALPGRASVSTGAATSIGLTEATLNATVNPNGSSTTAYFEYGTLLSYGFTTASQPIGSGTTAQPLSAQVTGLSCGTLYHYRATATNAGGTASGVDKTFTTACPPRASINDVIVPEGNGGTSSAYFTVTLSAPSLVEATVAYATAGSTAIPGSDYTSVSGTLTFAVGQATRTIAVPITGDTAVEIDEAFTVTLSAPTGATIARSTGTGTIANDDGSSPLPALYVDDRAVSEGSAVNAAFRIWLSAPASETITVLYGTADGSANADTDYVSTAGTITFSPGRTNHTIIVPIVTDSTGEGDETFYLNLGGTSGLVRIGDGQATGRISDPPAAQHVPMYRAYNRGTDYHFFTTDLASKSFAVDVLGFQDESSPIPFYVWNVLQTGSTPLFRMYNPNLGRHFYTAGVPDRDFLMSIGMVYEKDEGFIYLSPAPGTTELFKLYNGNSGTHLFTADAAQKDFILTTFAGVWVQHTSVGYVFTGP